MSAGYAQRIADMGAEDAHTENFSSRRGLLEIDDFPEYQVIYDNNPYRAKHVRPQQIAKLKTWLAENGIVVVAESAYPKSGEDEGYTVVLLVESGVPFEALDQAWGKIVLDSLSVSN